LKTSQLDLVISSKDLNHGNDREEQRAIREIFGNCPVLSPKTITGNAFAASGYIAVSLAAYLLYRGNPLTERKVDRILVNSFSVGTEKFSLYEELLSNRTGPQPYLFCTTMLSHVSPANVFKIRDVVSFYRAMGPLVESTRGK
jgi:hypothetical protein